MGRTIRTYRQRLKALQKLFSKLEKQLVPHLYSERKWTAAHYLSAPASVFPWPDTGMVTTLTVLIEFCKCISDLEEAIEGGHKT